MKVIFVGGARPNFMKIAPLIWELKRRNQKLKSNKIKYLFVHTGQHYDNEMSKIFFQDLSLPHPDINLGIGSASHAVQTAKIMIEFEKVCIKEQPDIVIVVGDVNSTIACTLVATKLGIKTSHVEAGLRSFDRSMPEEINRIITDSISDFLFTSCEDANRNLKIEGIPKEKIFFVGNIMIDTLKHCHEKSRKINIYKKYGLSKNNYALLTLHRPSNVDGENTLYDILRAVKEISNYIPIFFSVHPRTKKFIKKFCFDSLLANGNSIILTNPIGYLEFLSLMMDAKIVLTDSGGIQEETTVLGIPCLTLRNNTERPVTVKEGTNTVVGRCRDKIISETMKILRGENHKHAGIPRLWDGNTSERIIGVLIQSLI